MISVTAPPLFFFSCWYTCSLFRSSVVPFLICFEYWRFLCLNSSVFLFLFSSLSRILAFFLSNSFAGVSKALGILDTLLEFHGIYPLPAMLWFFLGVLDSPIGKKLAPTFGTFKLESPWILLWLGHGHDSMDDDSNTSWCAWVWSGRSCGVGIWQTLSNTQCRSHHNRQNNASEGICRASNNRTECWCFSSLTCRWGVWDKSTRSGCHFGWGPMKDSVEVWGVLEGSCFHCCASQSKNSWGSKISPSSRTCASTISPFFTMGGTPRNVFSMSMKWNERIECHSRKSVLSLSMILNMWVTKCTRLGLSCCLLKCVRFCSFFCSLRFSAKGVFRFAQSSSRVKSKKCVFLDRFPFL